MLRIKNTLDTVSKAVSGSHTELLSKIVRLKPNASQAGKGADGSAKVESMAEESAVMASQPPSHAAPPPTSSTPISVPNPSTVTASPTPAIPTAAATFKGTVTTSTPQHKPTKATVTATVQSLHDLKQKRLSRVASTAKGSSARKSEEPIPSSSDTEKKSANSKPTTALFHPSTFSVSFDETYNYLAHHINAYFGSNTKTEDKKVGNVDNTSTSSQGQHTSDLMPVPDKTDAAGPVNPTSFKKGFGHYLYYSAPTVQAFVGSYITPLVPKFRTAESKSAKVEEKLSEDSPAIQADATISKEQKAADEKAKKLLLQREKVGL